MQMEKENVKLENFEMLRVDEMMTVQGGGKREDENIIIRLRQFVIDLFQAD